MGSCILVRNVKTEWFITERGIRQGSALSAKLYLVHINELIEQINSCGLSAKVLDIQALRPNTGGRHLFSQYLPS